MKSKKIAKEVVFDQLKKLNAKGPDACLETSLFDYGFVYVPLFSKREAKGDRKGLVIFSQAKEPEFLSANPSLYEYTYDFVWISHEQIKQDVANQSDEFFSYIEASKPTYLANLTSDLDIVSAIWDLESYNAFYSSDCAFGYEVEDILAQLDGVKR